MSATAELTETTETAPQLECLVLQENLLRALNIIRGAVAKRTALPILENVLIEAHEGRLRLTATNLDLATRVHCGARIDAWGAVTVNFKELLAAVKAMPKVTIELRQEGDSLRVEGGRMVTTFAGMPATDFPVIPAVDGPKWEVAPGTLTRLIGNALPSVAKDDSRPVLSAIQFAFAGGQLNVTSADVFRLSLTTLPDTGKSLDGVAALLHGPAAKEVVRVTKLVKPDEPTAVTFADRSVSVLIGNDVEMVVQLVQGNYPNFAHLIPAISPTAATIDRRAFLAQCVACRGNSGIVRLSVGKTACRVWGTGERNYGGVASPIGDVVSDGQVDCTLTGETGNIAFNKMYLLDALESFAGETVTIAFSGPTDQALFTTESTADGLRVIMPMSVSW